jgi:hypothetical protein
MDSFSLQAKVVKADSSLGLVMGWAIVCKQDGVDYFDLQGDHIPEQAMLEASTDFMANSREARVMHQGASAGTVVFAWPMTTEVAKAFGIETDKTGLMVAMRPDPAVAKGFMDGTFTGFSIGGKRIEDRVVQESA